MDVRVSDVMTRRVVFAEAELTARELALRMRENSISSIVVLDGSSIRGIVTQDDLVTKVTAEGLDPREVNASDIMSTPVITVDSEANLEEAARIMRDKRIKKLFAVSRGKAVGILTSFDLVSAEPVLKLKLGE